MLEKLEGNAKSIGIVVAIVVSTWATVRGEMAKSRADTANDRVEDRTDRVEKNASEEATAVLAVLSSRIDKMDETRSQYRNYIAGMQLRDQYWERRLWELYRGYRGTRAADDVIKKAPPAPEPPVMSLHSEPMPKTSKEAKVKYDKACKGGDPLCTK